ncbi:MAG TPA: class I SAM-dependent methyltransferase [Chthoniobacterales bacterium]
MKTENETTADNLSARIDESKLYAFLNRAITDLAAGYGGVMVSLGRQLGLYEALAGAGPLSSHEVASRTGCAERYVREWLNSQVAGGYLAYHPSSQTYELLPEQALVLADKNSPTYIAPAWEVPASMWLDQPKAIEAFRTGKGVPWSDHDGRLYCGVAAFYRNGYRKQLVPEWLPSLDGVVEKLIAGARVADIGCGHGHSTVLMAEAFPNSRFYGFDSHEESIAAARENARQAGVENRVQFAVGTAKTLTERGLDLICFFDCLHDLGDPVGAAIHARQALSKDGTVLVVEPLGRDKVEDNINPVSQIYYSASTTLCCAHSLSEEVGLALGAQAGESRLQMVFQEAGFTRFRKAMETPFNLILEARP